MKQAIAINQLIIPTVSHCNNSCLNCTTNSPFMPQEDFSVEDYFPYLDLLKNEGISIASLSLTKGEPFLHRNIVDFTAKIRFRYSEQRLMITTNFAWANKKALKLYRNFIASFEHFAVSNYPNITSKLGGRKQFENYVDFLCALNPQQKINVWDKNFHIDWKFVPEKNNITEACEESKCTVLLNTGYIIKCSPVAFRDYANRFPNISENIFSDACFDLNNGTEGLHEWISNDIFTACAYCTYPQMKLSKWKSSKNAKENRKFNVLFTLNYLFDKLRYEQDYGVLSEIKELYFSSKICSLKIPENIIEIYNVSNIQHKKLIQEFFPDTNFTCNCSTYLYIDPGIKIEERLSIRENITVCLHYYWIKIKRISQSFARAIKKILEEFF